MAGNDNSFERQMMDFYGFIDCINIIYGKIYDTNKKIIQLALNDIMMDIKLKNEYISKTDLEKEKNKLQIELYNQLEKDRQNERMV